MRVFLVLAAVAVVSASCGSPPLPILCSANTCGGCCGDDGVCRPGGTPDSCGTNGGRCVACTGGAQCQIGVCQGGNTAGGSGTTAGGSEAGGTATTAGGSGATAGGTGSTAGGTGSTAGGMNATAGGTGSTAGGSGSTAGGSGGACNANNCSFGCCNGNTCELGTSSAACGKGGNACLTCGQGTSCQSQTCAPVQPPMCNATSCPTGCCNGTTCELGTANNACGSGGNACIGCGMGLACQNNACAPVNPAGCNSSTCPSGCCLNNVCQNGTSNGACGAGGNACGVCGANQQCTNQQCVTTNPGGCGPMSCGGCCANGQCLPGGDIQACGLGGSSCQFCVGLCFGGICIGANPTNGGSDGGTGSPCTQSSQCENSGLFEQSSCFAERRADGGFTGWVSGYCSSTCLLGSCPGNGTCLSDNNCYARCSQPGQGRASCRVGYVCLQLVYAADGGTIPGAGVCSPDCRNVGAGCAAGRTCGALGYCI